MPLLEVSGLGLSVSSGPLFQSRRREILKDVSIRVEEGMTLGLIGESGSGKTTLARCIAGLLTPERGTISFSGIHIFPEARRRRELGTSIQLLFQNHAASLDPRRRIRATLGEGLAGGEDSGGETRLRELLAGVGLEPELLGRFPHELSGGQRQRVALARGLSVSPRLLILDEPASSLDLLTQVQVVELLRKVQRNLGLALLYISHDLRVTASVSDRIAVLHDGVIVEEGPPGSILHDPRHPYTREIVRNTLP